MKHIVIIGGGAAGLVSAIQIAEILEASKQKANIRIFERDDRIGRSILVTGNGRCNFSRANIDTNAYSNSEFVASLLDASNRLEMPSDNLSFPKMGDKRMDAVHQFFSAHGLVWREEADGRQYPLSNKATSVLDILRNALSCYGIHEECEHTVIAIEAPRKVGGVYTLRMEDGAFERADYVVLACGGNALESFASSLNDLDISYTPMVHGLVPLSIKESYSRELDNIRILSRVSLYKSKYDKEPVAVEDGEVMFKKYGISGIAVFNLSRYAIPGCLIKFNFLAPCDISNPSAFLLNRARMLSKTLQRKATCEDVLQGLVLPRVGEIICKYARVSLGQPCGEPQCSNLAEALTEFTVTITGSANEQLCQVHQGGIQVNQINPSTAECKNHPRLLCVGEALDVDGPCGGYNLHWAWASGLVAGSTIAHQILGDV